VSVWTNRVGGFPCTPDALGCTTDECDGAGACTHDLYTGCLMDNTCIPSGATDPANECLGCFPAVSSAVYTPKAMGVACTDDGLNNTADICNGLDACVHPLLGECIIAGVTYRAGVANPANGCQSCQPAINIGAWTDRVQGFPCAGDGLDCTSDVCDGTGICDHRLYTGCLMGGACVAAGATDPSNECLGCFPATSTNSYTSKARGVACTDDGSAITGDFCNGANACIHPLLGECIIDGVTYRSGTANPANICQSCEPSHSVSGWSDRVNGFPCTTDGLDCTSDVCNGTGACTHPLYTGCLLGGACVIAGTNDPANDCNACDPAQSGTVYSPKPRGVACADDGQANTLDACNGASTCTHEVAGQCNIGGEVLNAGATNPANPCQSCDPSSSVSTWTDRVAGFPCTSDGLDCTADVCNATGACEHHLATGCLLNGACVAEGTTDPALECQACVPAQSTTAFTAKPRGVACTDDGQANTLDTCDGAGACAHVAGGQCSIQGVLFNAEAANPGNPCQVCDPATSVSAWTDRADGFPCTSDGLDCTSDVCGVGGVCEHRLFTGCLVDGSCVEAGGQNPANECTACIPATATNTYSSKVHGVACTDEGDATTLDQCNGSGTCLHLPGGECLINGVSVAAGGANPDNPCQACDAATAAFAWSNRVDGFPCGTDGLDCTSDVCNATGTCEHRLYTGCLMGGACVPEGATDPAGECRVCTAATATDAYSAKAMGTACSDDGMPNTTDACNGMGACGHTLMDQCVIGGATYNGGAANPANACQWCNPANSVSQWSNRAGGYMCASDNLLCTSDVCDGSGVCGHNITVGCLIGGACVAANATSPADECQVCLPATSRTAYSAAAQSDACGAGCVTDAECGDGKFCQASVCRPARVEGATCDANAQCSSGTCQEGVCAAAATTKSGCNCNASETDPTSAMLAALVLGWLFRRHARR
jgi:MYXO-CTERM domain-containing protein